MKRLALCLVLLLALAGFSAPKDGVVRLGSHGASATIIWTGQGRSYVLSCAHAFEGKYAVQRITVQAPAPMSGQRQTSGIRLLKVRHDLDLSLLELPVGPLPYVTPVAPPGFRSGRECLSVGFDKMVLPATVSYATIVAEGGKITYTREKPWPGRSGGALIDRRTGWLVGTVEGYETRPGGRGMYSSLAAIHAFLGPSWPRPTGPIGTPYVAPERLLPGLGGGPPGTAPSLPWGNYQPLPVGPLGRPDCPT